jgi:hypothetical protein
MGTPVPSRRDMSSSDSGRADDSQPTWVNTPLPWTLRSLPHLHLILVRGWVLARPLVLLAMRRSTLQTMGSDGHMRTPRGYVHPDSAMSLARTPFGLSLTHIRVSVIHGTSTPSGIHGGTLLPDLISQVARDCGLMLLLVTQTTDHGMGGLVCLVVRLSLHASGTVPGWHRLLV